MMKVIAINNNLYNTPNIPNKTANLNRIHYTPAQDMVTFSGLLGKNKTENLNSEELILSYKMADILHRLDKNSILVIGNPQHLFTKDRVKSELISSDSFLPSPKDIKDVYFINIDFSSPLIIARKNKEQFLVHGETKNLTNPKHSLLSLLLPKDVFDEYEYDNVVSHNDILKTIEGVRLKFIKTKDETNKPMYDAKYPVESFLSEGNYIGSGLILNSTKKIFKVPQKNEKIVNSDKSEYSKDFVYKTFDDIAGMDETIEEMKKHVLFPLIYPEAFPDVTNCGTILYGPPGTGKTLLAQAILGEVKKRNGKDIHFMNIDGQSLSNRYVGVTESMWRDVFKEAVEKQPSIIFIDEIDAILSARMDEPDNGTAKYCNSVVSQFLTLISDIEKNNDRVYIIGATNRPQAIDNAIKRKGRLGHMVAVNRPDKKGCFAILNHYLKDKNVSEDFDRDLFALKLYENRCTGADIANIVNLARDNMYERLGIYEQMDNGTFDSKSLMDLEYIEDDFRIE